MNEKIKEIPRIIIREKFWGGKIKKRTVDTQIDFSDIFKLKKIQLINSNQYDVWKS